METIFLQFAAAYIKVKPDPSANVIDFLDISDMFLVVS